MPRWSRHHLTYSGTTVASLFVPTLNPYNCISKLVKLGPEVTYYLTWPWSGILHTCRFTCSFCNLHHRFWRFTSSTFTYFQLSVEEWYEPLAHTLWQGLCCYSCLDTIHSYNKKYPDLQWKSISSNSLGFNSVTVEANYKPHLNSHVCAQVLTQSLIVDTHQPIFVLYM